MNRRVFESGFAKAGLKVTLFLTLCWLILIALSKITLPYDVHWYISRSSIGRVEELPDNSIDVAAFGGSTTYHSIAAMEMYKEYGISAFTVANSNQPMNTTYYMVDYFTSKQTPKVILLDVNSIFYESNMDGTRRALDILPLSRQKLSWIYDYTSLPGADSFLSFLFPVIKFHENYKKIEQGNFQIEDGGGHGWYHISNGLEMDPRPMNQEYNGITAFDDSRTPYSEFGITYFRKIANLCGEKGIDIILCAYPNTIWTIGQHNTIEDLAREYGLLFVDFNMPEALEAMDFVYAMDIRDSVHPNTFGAAKISSYIGKKIVEIYDLPDRRGQAGYEFQDEELTVYQRIFAQQSLQFLQFIETMDDYLDRLKNSEIGDCTVFFSIRDEGASGLTDEIKKQFLELGFHSDFADALRHSFIGVWQNGNVVYEELSHTNEDVESDSLTYEAMLPDGTPFVIRSAGYLVGNLSSIKIGESEYSKNGRGFNIVVWDNEKGEVIDSVNWDTYTGKIDEAIR